MHQFAYGRLYQHLCRNCLPRHQESSWEFPWNSTVRSDDKMESTMLENCFSRLEDIFKRGKMYYKKKKQKLTLGSGLNKHDASSIVPPGQWSIPPDVEGTVRFVGMQKGSMHVVAGAVAVAVAVVVVTEELWICCAFRFITVTTTAGTMIIVQPTMQPTPITQVFNLMCLIRVLRIWIKIIVLVCNGEDIWRHYIVELFVSGFERARGEEWEMMRRVKDVAYLG